MPWVSPITDSQTLSSIMLPFDGHLPAARIPAELWLYPASVPVSALVIGVCCALLWRRGRRRAAVAWAAAWVVVNTVEVIGKDLIHRPSLYVLWHGRRTSFAGFDNSFPSGHTMRALLIAAVVGLLWRRGLPAICVWAAVTLALLVVTNAHTPSDVLGGALLAGLVAALAIRQSQERHASERAERGFRIQERGGRSRV
jgi:membrane-associated phospholipid phosphatase